MSFVRLVGRWGLAGSLLSDLELKRARARIVYELRSRKSPKFFGNLFSRDIFCLRYVIARINSRTVPSSPNTFKGPWSNSFLGQSKVCRSGYFRAHCRVPCGSRLSTRFLHVNRKSFRRPLPKPLPSAAFSVGHSKDRKRTACPPTFQRWCRALPIAAGPCRR